MRTISALAFSLCLLSCAAEPTDDELAAADQAIIYGEDDRRDVYDDSQALARAVARTAIVALIPKSRLQRPATGEVNLRTTLLGSAYQLCKGERFAEQPTAADCTGVLIDADLIVTAGHCVQQAACTDYHYLFDYFYRAAGELEPVNASDVYACRQVVSQEISDRGGRQVDYAVIQLDRAVSGRTPLKVRTTAASEGEPLTVIGTGSGLPIKVDQGASVISSRSVERDYFMLEADTFEGSSGSAVIDREGALLGLLVRGGLDYVAKADGDCQLVNQLAHAAPGTLPSGDLAHEEATYVTRAVEGACGLGFPSKALCTREGRCGDDFCSVRESRESCPRDCDPCASGACGARGDVRFSAGTSVKQSPGSGRAEESGSCALSGAGRARAGDCSLLALPLLLLLGYRRRRRSFSRQEL